MLDAYIAATRPQTEGSAEDIIASHFEAGGRISRATFDEFGDPSIRKDTERTEKGAMGRSYFSSKATSRSSPVASLDTLAMNLSSEAGVEITPQDIIDFILQHPRGPRSFRQAENPHTTALATRYQEITGKRLTDRVLDEHRQTRGSVEADRAPKDVTGLVEDFLAARGYMNRDGTFDYARAEADYFQDRTRLYWTELDGLTDTEYEAAQQYIRQQQAEPQAEPGRVDAGEAQDAGAPRGDQGQESAEARAPGRVEGDGEPAADQAVQDDAAIRKRLSQYRYEVRKQGDLSDRAGGADPSATPEGGRAPRRRASDLLDAEGVPVDRADAQALDRAAIQYLNQTPAPPPSAVEAVNLLREALKTPGQTVSAWIDSLTPSRRDVASWSPIGQVVESAEDFWLLNKELRNPFFESVRIAVLDESNRVVLADVQTIGGLGSSIVDPSAFARMILAAREMGIKKPRVYASHNHPSGNMNPSKEDQATTEDLSRLADSMGAELVDHVITNGTKGRSLSRNEVFDMGSAHDVAWSHVQREDQVSISSPKAAFDLAALLRASNSDAAYAVLLNTKHAVIGAHHIDPANPSSLVVDRTRVGMTAASALRGG